MKQNRSWLKIKTLAKEEGGGGGGVACQWKSTVDLNREDYREILMEVWSGR